MRRRRRRSAYARALSRLSRLGQIARQKALSPARRREIARQAVLARWARAKAKRKKRRTA